MYDMSGRVALITGSGKKTGIGFAIAKRLSDEGVKVIISDVCKDIGVSDYVRIGDLEELEKLAAEIGGHALVLDVTDQKTIDDAASKIKSEFGHLDYLVNNAGGAPSPQYLQYMDIEMWKKTLDINLLGTLLITRTMIPLLQGIDGAAIVNTASRAGKKPREFGGAYCIAKAGLIMMSKVFALELSGLGIRVNAICPGQVDTDLERWSWELESKILQKDIKKIVEEEKETIPLGRIGTSYEIADLVAFLLSSEARYITGQAINIDGGQLLEI
jgi:NAD(P)-dependent dehydrogenase (short-subunit alcohol dehydrogenase family)